MLAPNLVATLSPSVRPRTLSVICALAIGSGVLAATFSGALLPLLLALVVLGLVVLPLARAHARASGYFVAIVVLYGMLIEVSAGQANTALTHRLRLVELVMLAIAALVAAGLRRRPLPLVLLVTPLLLALVDVTAFVNVGFARVVLTSGLNIYLHYFLLAIFVYYSSFGEREMRGLLVTMGAVFLIVAIVALVQFSTGKLFTPFVAAGYSVPSRAGAYRAVGFFAWPTELANFAGAWFFLFYCRAGRSGRALFYSIVCAALAVIVLASLTRTVLVCITALVFFIEIRRLSARARLVVCAAVVALVAVLALTYFGGAVRGASATLASSSRGYYLIQGAKVFEHNPLVGVGFGRYYQDWSAENDPGTVSVLDAYKIPKLDPRLSTTDSFLGSLMPEFGLVGAAVLLAFFLLLVWGGIRGSRTDRVTMGYAWCLVFMALNTAGSSQGLYAPHTVALWISIGMLARCLHSGESADGLDGAEITSASGS